MKADIRQERLQMAAASAAAKWKARATAGVKPFKTGDVARIVKPKSSKYGQEVTVADPDWNGMVKVEMLNNLTGVYEIKSFSFENLERTDKTAELRGGSEPAKLPSPTSKRRSSLSGGSQLSKTSWLSGKTEPTQQVPPLSTLSPHRFLVFSSLSP